VHLGRKRDHIPLPPHRFCASGLSTCAFSPLIVFLFFQGDCSKFKLKEEEEKRFPARFVTHNTPGEEFRLAREWKELRDRQEREKKDMEERHR
jgi:hypothetical protein